MKKRTFFTVVAAAIFALSASAGAAGITVPDAGFDDHVLTNVGDYIDIADTSSCSSLGGWLLRSNPHF